jgi:hypothetical protein
VAGLLEPSWTGWPPSNSRSRHSSERLRHLPVRRPTASPRHPGRLPRRRRRWSCMETATLLRVSTRQRRRRDGWPPRLSFGRVPTAGGMITLSHNQARRRRLCGPPRPTRLAPSTSARSQPAGPRLPGPAARCVGTPQGATGASVPRRLRGGRGAALLGGRWLGRVAVPTTARCARSPLLPAGAVSLCRLDRLLGAFRSEVPIATACRLTRRRVTGLRWDTRPAGRREAPYGAGRASTTTGATWQATLWTTADPSRRRSPQS